MYKCSQPSDELKKIKQNKTGYLKLWIQQQNKKKD
jgi:hypothetical protein